MKLIKIFSLLMLFFTIGCSSNDEDNHAAGSQLDALEFTHTLSNDLHAVELYTVSGTFNVGYNKVWLRIKDASNNEPLEPEAISWLPLMHMTAMQHSSPASPIIASEEKGIYEGYLIFQMAGNNSEYWNLQLDYRLNGTAYTASEAIDVLAVNKRNTNTFVGHDGKKYILSLLKPQHPKTGLNEMQAALFRMDDATNFSVVNNFRIKIDPRMPAMNNHGSPNNTDLVQQDSSQFYSGKLSLTMTGYWLINLQVFNAEGELVKGEEITPEAEAGSIYFEIEF